MFYKNIKCLIFISFLFLSFPSPVFAVTNVVINEFMAHPSSGNSEWVELYNPDHVDLSGYWIDDDSNFTSDSGSSTKKSLGNINTHNASYPYIDLSTFFNNSGDYVVLFASDGTIVDQYQYTKDPGMDVAMGRSPDGNGTIMVLASATKGSPNSQSEPTTTPTFTPSPSQIPTSTPTPISKPTATTSKSAPAATVTPTSSSKQQVTTAISPTQTPLGNQLTQDAKTTDKNIPTSMLGESTTSAALESSSPSAQSAENVKVAGNTNNSIGKIIMGIGVVFVAASGILAFRGWRARKYNDET